MPPEKKVSPFVVKLDEAAARDIYVRSWEGEFARKLAEEYGVHVFTVRSVKNKRTWKALTDAIDAELGW